MSIAVLAVLAVSLIAAPAVAQVVAPTPGVDAPPPASGERALQMPPLHELRLANGLRVVVASRHALPLVSASLLVLAGPEADPTGRAGLAATTATLLGTGAVRDGKPTLAGQLVQQAEALGSTLVLTSTWHASSAGLTVTTPKLDSALALLADVVRHPLLADDELKRVRAQQLGELRIELNDPSAVALMAARRAFWADTRYAATATAASLRRVQRSDVQAFHRRWYRPDNAVLVLAGDIDAPRARALAEDAFGGWKAPTTPLRSLDADAGTQKRTDTSKDTSKDKNNPARLVLIDMSGSGQSSVLLALPFSLPMSAQDEALAAEQWAVAQVANAVFGLGYSARLNQEVRIKRGLSYGVSSTLEIHPDAALLLAQGQTDHGNAPQVLQLLRDELQRMGDAAPSVEELRARQATVVGDFARRLETVGTLNALIVGHLAQGRSLQMLARQVERINAVTAQQVRDFALAHWPAAAQRAVVAGASAGDVAAWRAIDAKALRVPLPELDLERSALRQPQR